MSSQTQIQIRAKAALRLRRKRQEQARDDPYEAFKQTYRDNPCGFVLDCIEWDEGEGPTPYQLEILDALVAHRRVAIRGPHGLGKTAAAAWVILWFALTSDGTDDWKAVSTASVWRQLTRYLWPEIHKWARRLRWDVIGRRPFDRRLELQRRTLHMTTGEAFPVASNEPSAIEGAHAKRLLYVFDESKAIRDATFDAAEGALSTGDCYALVISTPGPPSGRFYEIHARATGLEDWWVRHVKKEELIQAGRMGPEWAEARRRQWGEESAVYQNRVLGEFAADDSNTVIPLAWVERANNRWLALQDDGLLYDGSVTRIAADVADQGLDQTVIAPLVEREDGGLVIPELRRHNKEDTMATTGRIGGLLHKHRGDNPVAVIDSIGIGAGVVARLREQGYRVVGFNSAKGTRRRDISGELGFVNLRAAAWWNAREMLDPANGFEVALPPDQTLIGDLTTPTYRPTSGGRIQIQSKDEIRKKINRSTDDGDAVVMALWKDIQPAQQSAGRPGYDEGYLRRRETRDRQRPRAPVSRTRRRR